MGIPGDQEETRKSKKEKEEPELAMFSSRWH